MPFESELEASFLSGKNEIFLTMPLHYYDNRSRELFIVPEGFICDGASIPRIAWSAVGHPFTYKVRESAVLHDFLYRNRVVKRKRADQIFYDALREQGMDNEAAQIFYLAVRAGGAAAYRS